MQNSRCDAIISSSNTLCAVLCSAGSAAACGLLGLEGAPQDAAVLAPVLQRRGAPAVFPNGIVDGQSRVEGRSHNTYAYLAGAQLAFGGVPACPTIGAKAALQSATVEAAVRGAGREPIILLGAGPTHFQVIPPAGALDPGREVLLKLASVVLVANSQRKVGQGVRDPEARKADQLATRALTCLQLLASLIIFANMAGQAREDAGLPTRSTDEAARALTAILPAGADPRQWLTALLAGGVALPIPLELHPTLVAVLERHARNNVPSRAPTGATGLGLERLSLGGPE
jgi:hypothetical protein